MDVGAWLRGLSLERYEQAFRDHDVDADLLVRLTAEDLREIGVVSVGHRRRLLEAAAALRGDAVTSSVPSAGAPERRTEPPGPESPVGAERRQLTVMFVDLVGSTALAAGLDPEDLRAAIRSYQDACAGVITRFGGFIAKYLGDGVLAYFGWPRTREDEAQQAVQAGLAVVEAVAGLAAPGGPLAARVGVATGLVVVGDLLGEGASREEAVTGETPNLAARLQGLAEPGTVVVADGTWRLLGGLFDAEDLGERPIHGFAGPIRAWRVLGERQVEGRFEARRAAGLTPLVGRGREIGLLLGRWGLAAGGAGQVILLAGEPGIGKSRLIETLRERLGNASHRFLRYQCSPQHTDSALYPFIAWSEHAAGFRREDAAAIRLAKLERRLRQEVEDVPAVTPLFAALLAIPTEGHYPPLALTPPQQKAKTLAALAGWIEAMTVRQPVLLVFEDLHWADPTSLEFLGTIIDRVARLPVLAVLTFRPEFASTWAGRADFLHLDLGRLAQHEAAALANEVGGGKALPSAILERVAAQTDGVPLFVEELTRAVLETGLLEEADGRYVLRGPLPPLAIPATLHDSLMARLDRLGPAAKEVAQLAACIGREFPHDILAAVAPCQAENLATVLDQLAASDLVVRHEATIESYAFRHALVQEAAYQSLLKSRRRQLHARIAETITAQFPDIAELQPEWLAHHYMEARRGGRAADSWFKAARRAKAAYAHREAAAHLEKCLEALSALAENSPPGPPAVARRLEALVLLGDVASLTGDLEGANRHYARALEIAPDAATRIAVANKQHRPTSRSAPQHGSRSTSMAVATGRHCCLSARLLTGWRPSSRCWSDCARNSTSSRSTPVARAHPTR